MSGVSRVSKLPPEVRLWINRRLYEVGFSNYIALAKEITEKGYAVSASSLQRYGKQLRDRVRNEEIKELRNYV